MRNIQMKKAKKAQVNSLLDMNFDMASKGGGGGGMGMMMAKKASCSDEEEEDAEEEEYWANQLKSSN
jgi:hypothetical protein